MKLTICASTAVRFVPRPKRITTGGGGVPGGEGGGGGGEEDEETNDEKVEADVAPANFNKNSRGKTWKENGN